MDPYKKTEVRFSSHTRTHSSELHQCTFSSSSAETSASLGSSIVRLLRSDVIRIHFFSGIGASHKTKTKNNKGVLNVCC
jgi:hypothetical protein